MPESLFKQYATSDLGRNEFLLDKWRAELITSLPGYAEHGPTHASTCYIWPSSECPVGCGHCNYASPMSLHGLSRYSVARDPEPVMRLMNGMKLWKAVLSGGGEPMVEPEFCQVFVNGIDSPNLEEIELITSAHFASDPATTRRHLRDLVGAWRSRAPNLARAAFTVRISLDWFHAQRIGVEPTAQVIRILGEDDMRDVGCYIRSVLLDNDDTIVDLAERLDGRLSRIRDYQQRIYLPDGRVILVYFKNLIIDGRMNQRKLRRLPVGVPRQSRADVFGKRFENDQGKNVPARTYNGPRVRQLEGLACLVEDNGMIRILEGNDPSRCPNVRTVDDWPQAIRYLYADPITVYLVERGPQDLAELLADAFPESVTLARDTNQLYHLTEMLLASPAKRLYATIRILDLHAAESRISVDSNLIERARAALIEHLAIGRDGS